MAFKPSDNIEDPYPDFLQKHGISIKAGGRGLLVSRNGREEEVRKDDFFGCFGPHDEEFCDAFVELGVPLEDVLEFANRIDRYRLAEHIRASNEFAEKVAKLKAKRTNANLEEDV